MALRGRSNQAIVAAAVLAALALAASVICIAGSGESVWRTLEPGLEMAEFAAPLPDGGADAAINVLRVDPEVWELRLFNTSASDEGELHSTREWCELHDLAAAINAAMFQKDYRTSVSLMRTSDHINNSYVSPDKTVLAFDALDDSVPAVRIIDRTCSDLDTAAGHYGTLIQSIRMVSCRGNNVWAPQKRRHSTAAVGVDGAGRFLMIHCRAPFSTHDLIEILLDLPLAIESAMYVEGGPEAQLFIDAGGVEREFVGSFESGILESDLNRIGWPIPNVIGISRRAHR